MKYNCERVQFLVKLQAVGLQIYKTWTPSQIFYKESAKTISSHLSLFFKNFNNKYFLGIPFGECLRKFWKLNGVLKYRCSWNSKMSYVLEFQAHLFFRIPFSFHSLFFASLLMPGGGKSTSYENKPALKSCRFV